MGGKCDDCWCSSCKIHGECDSCNYCTIKPVEDCDNFEDKYEEE